MDILRALQHFAGILDILTDFSMLFPEISFLLKKQKIFYSAERLFEKVTGGEYCILTRLEIRIYLFVSS